jgi:hypothetical protein
MALVDPYSTLAVPKDLVADFFGVFARCEFAMKDTHLYERAEGGRAAPAWRALANDAVGWLQVLPGSELEHAIDALTRNPPRVQLMGSRTAPRSGTRGPGGERRGQSAQ